MKFKVTTLLSLSILPFLCSASQIISDPSMKSTAPTTAINSTNQALASWVANNQGFGCIQASIYDGSNWSAPTTLSDSNLEAGAATISYNEQGKGVAIWPSTDVAQKTTVVQTAFYNSSWSGVVTLSNPSNSAQKPQVALNSNGDALAIWMEGFGSGSTYNQLFSSQYTGGSWSTSTTITLNWGGLGDARVGFNTTGQGIAAWSQNVGGLSQIFISFYSSGSWTMPQAISSPGVHSFTPDLYWNDNNNALVCWQAYIGSLVQIQAINYNGSSWDSVQTLSDQPYNALIPRCALNNQGNAIVTWSSYTGSEYGVFAATQTNGGSWSTPVRFSVPGYDYSEPVVGLNNSNQALVVWTTSPWNSNLKMIQAVSWSGGNWSSPISLSDPTGISQTPSVSLNNGGSAVVVWDRLSGATDVIEASFESLP